MDRHTPTGSVSDHRGWEWNRVYGEDSDRESRHPRKFAPNRYRGESEGGGESEQRQSEIDRLRKEVSLRPRSDSFRFFSARHRSYCRMSW